MSCIHTPIQNINDPYNINYLAWRRNTEIQENLGLKSVYTTYSASPPQQYNGFKYIVQHKLSQCSIIVANSSVTVLMHSVV